MCQIKVTVTNTTVESRQASRFIDRNKIMRHQFESNINNIISYSMLNVFVQTLMTVELSRMT